MSTARTVRAGARFEKGSRTVVLRRGRRVGWWVEGRSAGGRLFMKTWWPSQGLARAVARLVGGRVDPAGGTEAVNGDQP